MPEDPLIPGEEPAASASPGERRTDPSSLREIRDAMERLRRTVDRAQAERAHMEEKTEAHAEEIRRLRRRLSDLADQQKADEARGREREDELQKSLEDSILREKALRAKAEGAIGRLNKRLRRAEGTGNKGDPDLERDEPPETGASEAAEVDRADRLDELEVRRRRLTAALVKSTRELASDAELRRLLKEVFLALQEAEEARFRQAALLKTLSKKVDAFESALPGAAATAAGGPSLAGRVAALEARLAAVLADQSHLQEALPALRELEVKAKALEQETVSRIAVLARDRDAEAASSRALARRVAALEAQAPTVHARSPADRGLADEVAASRSELRRRRSPPASAASPGAPPVSAEGRTQAPGENPAKTDRDARRAAELEAQIKALDARLASMQAESSQAKAEASQSAAAASAARQDAETLHGQLEKAKALETQLAALKARLVQAESSAEEELKSQKAIYESRLRQQKALQEAELAKAREEKLRPPPPPPSPWEALARRLLGQ